MENTKLASAVLRICLSYVLMHLDINIGKLDLLPEWMGYLLILSTLKTLSEYKRASSLLKPLGIALMLCSFIGWILNAYGAGISVYSITAVVSALSLFFHFRLLTDIADIAYDTVGSNASIIFARNARTVLSTVMALPISWQDAAALSWILILLQIMTIAVLLISLLSFKSSLNEK